MKSNVKVPVLIILFICFIGVTANAAPVRKYSTKPTEGIESPYADYGFAYNSGITNNLSTDSVLQYGEISSYTCSIYKVSSGYIKGYGKTVATTMVDEIGYTLYFQMWNGYSWINIDSTSNTGYNTTNVQDYHYRTVQPNKYYRVKAVHYVLDNGIKNTTESTSTYIFVD